MSIRFDTHERGESNGIRRGILPVRGTRRGAVTETIKVIAEKMSRVPIPQFEPPEKRDRLLSKGNNNGNFGEAILVNLTIRTWHTKTVKRIEAAGK